MVWLETDRFKQGYTSMHTMTRRRSHFVTASAALLLMSGYAASQPQSGAQTPQVIAQPIATTRSANRVGFPSWRSPTSPASGGGSTTPGPLLNFGGPVQTAPAVYVVYWNWTTDPYGVQAYLNSFLSDIGGSSWLSPVTQYSGAGNPASLLRGTWSDPNPIPASPSAADIQNEALRALAFFGLSASTNIQIIVATPTGHSSSDLSGDCAYHSTVSGQPYTNLPYMPDFGGACGSGHVNGPLDGVSIVEGHELAETITDPQINGWQDLTIAFPSPGHEIGDKCVWTDLENITTNVGTQYPVQPLWSNAANGCVLPSGLISPNAPSLSDANGGTACPRTSLEWNSVAGAVSYQVWSRPIHPTLQSGYGQIWSGTATSLTVSVPRSWTTSYTVTSCNSSGWCSGLSDNDLVTGGICE